jgi:molybdopterin converting factor small subunit
LTVTVRVRFFASLVDSTGCRAVEVEASPDQRVVELWETIQQQYAGLRSLGYRPLVACDRRYADWDQLLGDVREVAFLPPVSGG